MDIKDYFDKVELYLDGLTNSEFEALLIESGIEECRLVDAKVNISVNVDSVAGVYGQSSPYVSHYQPFPVFSSKVA